jgi:hypothetical protein
MALFFIKRSRLVTIQKPDELVQFLNGKNKMTATSLDRIVINKICFMTFLYKTV